MSYIPIYMPQADEVCPECGRLEDIVRSCRHCHHVYADHEFSDWKEILINAVIVAVLIWFCWTMMKWLVDSDRLSLLDVLKNQWSFIISLRVL